MVLEIVLKLYKVFTDARLNEKKFRGDFLPKRTAIMLLYTETTTKKSVDDVNAVHAKNPLLVVFFTSCSISKRIFQNLDPSGLQL
jgi:hypothetical protein